MKIVLRSLPAMPQSIAKLPRGEAGVFFEDAGEVGWVAEAE